MYSPANSASPFRENFSNVRRVLFGKAAEFGAGAALDVVASVGVGTMFNKGAVFDSPSSGTLAPEIGDEVGVSSRG